MMINRIETMNLIEVPEDASDTMKQLISGHNDMLMLVMQLNNTCADIEQSVNKLGDEIRLMRR